MKTQTEKVKINGETVEIKVNVDPTTKSLNCYYCNASAPNSDDIVHRSCCKYVGGSGC
jgi:O-acetylhomoserine/O-acetylserine sulfhydrylase-like pyridoxal-dependent enzyme